MSTAYLIPKPQDYKSEHRDKLFDRFNRERENQSKHNIYFQYFHISVTFQDMFDFMEYNLISPNLMALFINYLHNEDYLLQQNSKEIYFTMINIIKNEANQKENYNCFPQHSHLLRYTEYLPNEHKFKQIIMLIKVFCIQ